jgi:hypothetical protein
MRNWPPVFAMVGVLVSGTPIAAKSVCKPALTVNEVAFSAPINLRRYWTATVAADTSLCASQSGFFSLGFVRLAENAPDLSFIEPFVWHAGENMVRVEFWADEAVHEYWIADVARCTCRDEN